MLVGRVKQEIGVLESKFNALKVATIQCLERFRISVMCIVYTLTSLRADDIGEHEMFLKQRGTLNQSQNHWELFGSLNLYWNYLAYHLLDHIIVEVFQTYHYLTDAEGKTIKQSLTDIKGRMESYKTDVRHFRIHTTLQLFCEAQKEKIDDTPPSFREIVVKHNWSEHTHTATLEEVEMFRRCYLRHYNLRNCALMLNSIRHGTFTVTWFVPSSVVDILKKERPVNVLKGFNVIRMEVAGSCVYEAPDIHHVSLVVQSQNVCVFTTAIRLKS